MALTVARTRHIVESGSLASIAYDAETATLTVEFWHGGVYEYTSVPENVWTLLLSSTSKGEFFNEHVRDAYFGTKLL